MVTWSVSVRDFEYVDSITHTKDTSGKQKIQNWVIGVDRPNGHSHLSAVSQFDRSCTHAADVVTLSVYLYDL